MTSEQIINIYKYLGETPLEAINRLKVLLPEYGDKKLSYAGRLDPLAEGVLLLTTGQASVNKDEYLDLPKTYEVGILLGASTDTFDTLGLVTDPSAEDITYPKHIVATQAKEMIKKLLELPALPYPVYSSKPVNGKPLFQWAKEGRLSEIEIPLQPGKAKAIKYIGAQTISASMLHERIKKQIEKVNGDFRQKEILERWVTFFDFLSKNAVAEGSHGFQIITLKVECESGVYMRSLAHQFGVLLGLPALAFSIIRTSVGDYHISHSIRDSRFEAHPVDIDD
jgi:tRNA pseudouridine55 synthase